MTRRWQSRTSRGERGGRGGNPNFRGGQRIQGNANYTFSGSALNSAPQQLRSEVRGVEPQNANHNYNFSAQVPLKIPGIYKNTEQQDDADGHVFGQHRNQPVRSVRDGADRRHAPRRLLLGQHAAHRPADRPAVRGQSDSGRPSQPAGAGAAAVLPRGDADGHDAQLSPRDDELLPSEPGAGASPAQLHAARQGGRGGSGGGQQGNAGRGGRAGRRRAAGGAGAGRGQHAHQRQHEPELPVSAVGQRSAERVHHAGRRPRDPQLQHFDPISTFSAAATSSSVSTNYNHSSSGIDQQLQRRQQRLRTPSGSRACPTARSPGGCRD